MSFRILNSISILSLLLSCFNLHAESTQGPKDQELAENWLQVRVLEAEEVEGQMKAKVSVVSAFKSKQEIKDGDEILIQYKLAQQPEMKKGARPTRPIGLPRLRAKMLTYAFLNPTDEEGVYAPGASIWSFAPPFGVSAENLEKYKMKMPAPPNFTPPKRGMTRPIPATKTAPKPPAEAPPKPQIPQVPPPPVSE